MPRIRALDILRGIAILGILFMNINDMGGSFWASSAHVRYFGWGPIDRAAWTIRELLAEGTARCLLEMLFGAGMAILTDRAARSVDELGVVRGYYYRNIVLALFGCVHLFVLLWPGDILHTYGLAALVAFWFRRMKLPWLLVLASSFMMFSFADNAYDYARETQDQRAIAVISQHQRAGQPASAADRALVALVAAQARSAKADDEQLRARIFAEDKARRAPTATAASWAVSAWTSIAVVQGEGEEAEFIWEAVAAMLIGVALFRSGMLQGRRSARFYAAMLVAGYAAGLAIRVPTVILVLRADESPALVWGAYEAGRIAMTLGHIALIHLALRQQWGRRLLDPFAAAGKTALSIYILQTLICVWLLFPPFGLALYGRMGWAGFMLTALVINAALLVIANVYLRHFSIGPVEWAWRSTIEGRLLPWRESARSQSITLDNAAVRPRA